MRDLWLPPYPQGGVEAIAGRILKQPNKWRWVPESGPVSHVTDRLGWFESDFRPFRWQRYYLAATIRGELFLAAYNHARRL